MKYSMTCACGDVMSVEGATREEAVANMKAMMTDEMIAKHAGEKHAGEPGLTQEQVHQMIEEKMVEAA